MGNLLCRYRLTRWRLGLHEGCIRWGPTVLRGSYWNGGDSRSSLVCGFCGGHCHLLLDNCGNGRSDRLVVSVLFALGRRHTLCRLRLLWLLLDSRRCLGRVGLTRLRSQHWSSCDGCLSCCLRRLLLLNMRLVLGRLLLLGDNARLICKEGNDTKIIQTSCLIRSFDNRD